MHVVAGLTLYIIEGKCTHHKSANDYFLQRYGISNVYALRSSIIPAKSNASGSKELVKD